MLSRFKTFSDPVHGFIAVPRTLLLPLIQTPEVQRLRRIRQLGVGYLVFPGAEHTRFGHALGAMALMHDTLANLREHGTPVSEEEHQAALAAALLHDLGHGPFSHTLERELIDGFHHEAMSRVMVAYLNDRFDGALNTTLQIFDDTYPRPFFHQLLSSQLDMDRLDYLRRDSFYTGVVEGDVGVERIIRTMRVHPVAGGPDSQVVLEAKSLYPVESFLSARRLMYGQVYLHRTVLAGDQVLRAVVRRARTHLAAGAAALLPHSSPAFRFFLERPYTANDLAAPLVRQTYTALDDSDILFSLKQWMHSPDPLLADLCRRFLQRDFFRVAFLPEPLPEARMQEAQQQVASFLVTRGLSAPDTALPDATYYLMQASVHHEAYGAHADPIGVLNQHQQIIELSQASRLVAALGVPEVRPYVCFPKEVKLDFPGG